MSALDLIRPELRAFDHYVSVRPQGVTSAGTIYLDANESPTSPIPAGAMGQLGRDYNRYPEPQPKVLISLLARLFSCAEDQVLVTRGSDEGIDVLVRTFCVAYRDAIVICPPTFGMYAQAAKVQGARIVEVPFDPIHDGQLTAEQIVGVVQSCQHVKLVFICRPNNPVGADLDVAMIDRLCSDLAGIAAVVVDEAYVDFADEPSVTSLVGRPHENLMVLRTLSKAYGLAGVRVGGVIACSSMIRVLQTVLPVYPISRPAIDAVCLALTPQGIANKSERLRQWITERERVRVALMESPLVQRVFASSANFLLVQTTDAVVFCERLAAAGIIVRSRTALVAGGVRVTIGLPEHNDLLLRALGVSGADGEALEGGLETKREASVMRRTAETSVEVFVDLDGGGATGICTGIAFFDHMLDQVARHGGLTLRIRAAGDLEVDAHHTIEDVALVFGEALSQALGERRGVARFGWTMPMDDAQARLTVDLGGRPYCSFRGEFKSERVGQFPTQLTEHFFRSLATTLRANIHAEVSGSDDHHKIESLFKALGLVLRHAVSRTGSSVLPSTKGHI